MEGVGELGQDAAELVRLDERRQSRHELGESGFVVRPLVGQFFRGFQGEDKVSGDLGRHTLQGPRIRQAVVGKVELAGFELAGVESEPILFGQLLWVIGADPIFVAETAGADQDHLVSSICLGPAKIAWREEPLGRKTG